MIIAFHVHSTLTTSARFLDNVTTDIIHYEQKKVILLPRSPVKLRSTLIPVGLLSRKPLGFCRQETRGEVLLHSGGHQRQIRLPSPRFIDGCP